MCTNNYLPRFLRCPLVSFRTVITGAFFTAGRRMRRLIFIALIMLVILLGTNKQISKL